MLGGQLSAVLPVHLVAVVLLGVVGGGHVDARLTAVLADGEGQLRRGAHGLEQPHLDAVGGHDAGGFLGKLRRVVPAVKAHGNALCAGIRPLCLDHFGEGLGGVTDDVDVHLMQAGTHGATQTGGAEGELVKEAALNLLGVVGDGFQLGLFRRGEGGAVEPFLIRFQIRHNNTSEFQMMSWVSIYDTGNLR